MKIFVLMFCSFFSIAGNAQEKLSFALVDAKSLQLYEDSEWEKLIEFGNEGLDSGFDYYYLRLRVGIAYYNLNRFEKAHPHFKKALEFNELDPLALEYLYYSLLFAGRVQESRLVSSAMPEHTRRKLGIPGEIGVKGIFFEGGKVGIYKLDSLLAYQPEGAKVDHYVLKNYSYLAGGIDLYPGRRLSLKIAVNNMSFTTFQEVSVSSRFGVQKYTSDYLNSQSGFYMGGEFTLNPDWYFGLAGQILKGDFSYMEYRPAPPGMDQVARRSFMYKDFVIEGALKHRFTTVLAGANLAYSDLGDQSGLKAGLDLTWYPKGSINFYLQSEIDKLISLETSGDDTWVLQGLIGGKIFPHLWLETHAGLGNMAGWSEKSAYIVYNNQDPILSRGGINMIIPEIIRGLSLTFRYQLQQREHSWAIDNGGKESEYETKKYLTNSIIGGITWNF